MSKQVRVHMLTLAICVLEYALRLRTVVELWLRLGEIGPITAVAVYAIWLAGDNVVSRKYNQQISRFIERLAGEEA